MTRRRQPPDTETNAPLANLSETSRSEGSLVISLEPAEPSVIKRTKQELVRELRHPAAVLVPLRLFLGIGWLRAFAEKALAPEWFDGRAVGLFLDSRVSGNAVVFPLYRQLIETVLRPGSRWIGWVVMLLQLVAGLALLLGLYTNLAILIGISMNANFMFAGQVSPSAFYIMMQVVLFVSGAGAILGVDGTRVRRPGRASSILLVAQPYLSRASRGDRWAVTALAVLAAALSWFGLAHAADWSPTGISDPGLVFGTIMGLSALSLVILRLRLGEAAKPRR